MASNLPPGCSESDIPGNRPEDLEWDQLWDEMADWGLSPAEIRGRVSSGLLEAAEKAEKAIAYNGTPTHGLAEALGLLRTAIAKAKPL